MIVIKLLGLHQLRDHQPGVFHIITRHAGKGHRRHLAGKIGRAGSTRKRQHGIGIVCKTDNGRRNGLIICGHLARQHGDQPGVSGLHRQANTFQVRERILLARGAPGAEQRVTGVWLAFARQPQLFRAGPGFLLLTGRPFRIVVITLRFRRARFIRAESQQAAPVFATGQLVHKPGLQGARRRQGRVRLNEVIHGDGRLIHEIVRDLTILKIWIQRIILQRRHQRLHGIHLLVVPCLFNLGIAVTLFIQ